MKITMDLKEVNQYLQKLSGVEAYIEAYHVSLGRLAIRLYSYGMKEVYYLTAAGCKYIQGPFRFEPAHLTVTMEEDTERGVKYIVRDPAFAFELIASAGICIVVGAPGELGQPFEYGWIGSE